jgi:WW domain-containing oxidoreductase
MSLLSMLKGRGPSGFGYGSTAEEVTAGLDLSGRTFLVTGANSGLGLETVRVLALRGARVLAAGRSAEKVREACGHLGPRVEPLSCELSEPASVRACVAAVSTRLDAIICNAGIMALPQLQRAHGYELQFLTNHLGHFILVTGLLDRLTDEGRVVMLSSDAHRRAPKEGIQFDNLDGAKGYAPWTAYGQSKLANLLFARSLARRMAGTRRTANALHPGVIMTPLARSLSGALKSAMAVVSPLVLKTVGEGAATQTYLATSSAVAGVSGEYFADCNVSRPSRLGQDDALAERLWAETERIVAGLR